MLVRMESFFPFINFLSGASPPPFRAKEISQVYIFAITPRRHESAWIRYKLELAGSSVTDVAIRAGVTHGSVSQVVSGRSHSARIEAEIARIIGYPSWNEMLKAVRSGAA